MKRAYYSNRIQGFLRESVNNILGELTKSHSNSSLKELQINAWRKQIQILKNQLQEFEGKIYFEFAIPRMGKRVDNIIIINDTAFIVEFKVGNGNYEKHAIEQVIDYTIDLKNFHEGSHHIKLIPVLVATNAIEFKEPTENIFSLKSAAKANQNNLKEIIIQFVNKTEKPIDTIYWENSIYQAVDKAIEEIL